MKSARFNEAVGYYRRNHMPKGKIDREAQTASMRPSDITDGIASTSDGTTLWFMLQ